jgi:Fe-S cluster assembly ATP-binding protein
MKTPLLSISDLYVSIDKKPLIKGFSLDVYEGEIHAIMGPNGTGKSTLAKVLAGHPKYEVEQGSILFKGRPLLSLSPEERAAMGLFIGFQYPVEIKGISNKTFLFHALNSQRKVHGEAPLDEQDFQKYLMEQMDLVGLRSEFLERDVNEGFSGGEKKRNEIVQLAVLNPSLSILDETDSGLDIDALKTVANGVLSILNKDKKKALLLITHYQRLLDYIQPHFVHVMMEGRLVRHGGKELVIELEKKGYEGLIE